MKMKPGDLTYIPSNAKLFKFDGQNDVISKYHELEKPVNLLILEHDGSLVKVSYEGEEWFVKTCDSYEAKNE